MTNKGYVRCEHCKVVEQMLEGEWESQYCGNDLSGSDRVSEKVWWDYWTGVNGQPFHYNYLKASTQTTFLE